MHDERDRDATLRRIARVRDPSADPDGEEGKESNRRERGTRAPQTSGPVTGAGPGQPNQAGARDAHGRLAENRREPRGVAKRSLYEDEDRETELRRRHLRVELRTVDESARRSRRRRGTQ